MGGGAGNGPGGSFQSNAARLRAGRRERIVMEDHRVIIEPMADVPLALEQSLVRSDPDIQPS